HAWQWRHLQGRLGRLRNALNNLSERMGPPLRLRVPCSEVVSVARALSKKRQKMQLTLIIIISIWALAFSAQGRRLRICQWAGHAVSHSRHEPARMDRTCDFVGLASG